jgi:hypothetical protein
VIALTRKFSFNKIALAGLDKIVLQFLSLFLSGDVTLSLHVSTLTLLWCWLLGTEILFWCPVVPRTCSSLSIRDAVDPEAEFETRGVRRQIRESRCQVLLQSDDKDNAHGDCQGAVCLPAGKSNPVLLTMLPSLMTSMLMRRGVYACAQEFPLQFLNAHAHEFDEHATFESKSLQRNSNKRWPVRITVRHFVADDKKRVFAYGDGGWSAFFMENQVRLGDLLVFQLIGFSRFRVYVFPVHISQRGNDGDHHERSLFSGSR